MLSDNGYIAGGNVVLTTAINYPDLCIGATPVSATQHFDIDTTQYTAGPYDSDLACGDEINTKQVFLLMLLVSFWKEHTFVYQFQIHLLLIR